MAVIRRSTIPFVIMIPSGCGAGVTSMMHSCLGRQESEFSRGCWATLGYVFFFFFLVSFTPQMTGEVPSLRQNPQEQENLWWSMTHIASVHLMKALRADAVRMWAGLLSSACGSISSGWQSRRSSANLLQRLLLGADWRSAVTLCLRLGTRGMLWNVAAGEPGFRCDGVRCLAAYMSRQPVFNFVFRLFDLIISSIVWKLNDAAVR